MRFSTHPMADFSEKIGGDVPNLVVPHGREASARAIEGVFDTEFLAACTLGWEECRLPSIAQAESVPEASFGRANPCSSMGSVESQVDAPFSEARLIDFWREDGNFSWRSHARLCSEFLLWFLVLFRALICSAFTSAG